MLSSRIDDQHLAVQFEQNVEAWITGLWHVRRLSCTDNLLKASELRF